MVRWFFLWGSGGFLVGLGLTDADQVELDPVPYKL